MGWNWKGESTVQVFVNSPDSLLASFISENDAGKLIIITGPSGSGKTHWCLELIEQAKAKKINAGGLVSPPVFEGDMKVSIDLVDVTSGSRQRLAVRRGISSSGQFTLDWIFNDEALAWGNSILGQLEMCQLLVLDEMGPLELERGSGLSHGIGLINARHYGLACVVVRPSLLEIAMNLWPWGSVSYVRTNDHTEVFA
jgi:nucleoside-triphosphatase THEP1